MCCTNEMMRQTHDYSGKNVCEHNAPQFRNSCNSSPNSDINSERRRKKGRAEKERRTQRKWRIRKLRREWAFAAVATYLASCRILTSMPCHLKSVCWQFPTFLTAPTEFLSSCTVFDFPIPSCPHKGNLGCSFLVLPLALLLSFRFAVTHIDATLILLNTPPTVIN